MKAPICLITLFLLTAGCGPEPRPEETPPKTFDPACTRDAEERDFDEVSGWSGRAVDETGALRPPEPGTEYLISTTYLQLRPTEEAITRFRSLTQEINATLPSHEGLLAVKFASSDYCGTARTLTVWQDADAMYRFVGSPAHVNAMAATGELSRGGSMVTSWMGSEASATWEEARAQLKVATRSPR